MYAQSVGKLKAVLQRKLKDMETEYVFWTKQLIEANKQTIVQDEGQIWIVKCWFMCVEFGSY